MGIPPGDTHPALMILIILAFFGECLLQRGVPRGYPSAAHVRYVAQISLGLCSLLEHSSPTLVENYWIADEIYPFVPK